MIDIKLDDNFIRTVLESRFPQIQSINQTYPQLTRKDYLELFDSQILTRHIDLQARSLKQRGLGFYTISSAGHESNAALARAFNTSDMAFLHYRSAAFMLERSRQVNYEHQVYDQLLSLVAAKSDPIASGRHKVFGNLQLNVPPQTSTIASHLPKAVGAAFAITRAKRLKHKIPIAGDSVILCSFGDASFNHSTAQGALNTAQWLAFKKFPLPLVFVCEDNGWGISVPTSPQWIANAMQHRSDICYIAADGLNLNSVYTAAKKAETIARVQRKPVFLHLKMVRLLGHAGSDIETQYRDKADIEACEARDPLLYSAAFIRKMSWLTAEEIIERYEANRIIVAKQLDLALQQPQLKSAAEVMADIVPTLKPNVSASVLSTVKRQIALEKFSAQISLPRTMAQQINLALFDILLQFPETLIFGEDVGRKGGVYHITAELQWYFGKRRVFDSVLDEQSILGFAIGLSQMNFLPIVEIQFLAYIHNAIDQLRGEAASLSFFSNSQYTNPMVIRVPAFAYQKGFGGHFHNENAIAFLREIPGLIIACPSNGSDAALMLRECTRLAREQQRIVVFLEPIGLYTIKDLYAPGDNLCLSSFPSLDQNLKFGELGIYGDGQDIAIVSYGNGYYLLQQAEKILREQHAVYAKIIDLRWLAPLNEKALITELCDFKRILIVDECRRTGSLSEGLIALMLENLQPLPIIERLTAQDSFIPLGPASQYVLPSRQDIVAAVLALISRSI